MTVSLPPARLDVVGVGNALVDILAQATDPLLDELGVVKGSMELVEAERVGELYERAGPAVESSGGSAANTIAGLASLGSRTGFIGRIFDDQLGHTFVHDLSSLGVECPIAPVSTGPSTGCCLVLVTPDGERTMNTFLGAASLLDAEQIDERLIADADTVFLEGYLFDRDGAKDAFGAAADIAHAAGRRVSMTLSDTFCVERHHADFRSLIATRIDLLFANAAEIAVLYETDDLDRACDAVAADCDVAVITRSEHGSRVVAGDLRVDVAAVPVERVVDTTGAGDQFAAGFLAGWTRGVDLPDCARLGSVAAAEVISHYGPRPETSLRALAGSLLPDR